MLSCFHLSAALNNRETFCCLFLECPLCFILWACAEPALAVGSCSWYFPKKQRLVHASSQFMLPGWRHWLLAGVPGVWFPSPSHAKEFTHPRLWAKIQSTIMKMEAVHSSETMVSIYQATRCHIPKYSESNLHRHCSENYLHFVRPVLYHLWKYI
jgi:hypothetical protein